MSRATWVILPTGRSTRPATTQPVPRLAGNSTARAISDMVRSLSSASLVGQQLELLHPALVQVDGHPPVAGHPAHLQVAR